MGKSGSKSKRSKQLGPAWLEPAWSSLARRLAVATGAAAAVIALLVEVPLLPAVGRGALAWYLVLWVFRLGGRLVAAPILEDPPEPADEAAVEPEARRRSA